MAQISSAGRATAQSTKRLSEKNLETVIRLENEQKEFKNLIASSKEYSEIEKNAINVTTVAEFKDFWQNTKDAKEDFDRSHEKGCGLCSKTYQSSAVVVGNFMDDFSPILDIVKNFAAPYGGMAVGTISVLFVVAGNKDNMEESLASAISAIQDRLPGLELYQHIYNENHELDMRLQAQIVSAYKGFIEFCIEASKYYKGGGPHQKLTIEKQTLTIEKQTLTIERLDEKVRQLQEAQDVNTLTEIQRLLNLSNFSDETQRKELEKYREALRSDEQLNAAYFEQMRGARLDSFKTCNDYQSWINSEHSSLLILSGYNNKSIDYLDQCWLSPVAVDMIMDLRLNPNHPIYSYYVFRPQSSLIYRPLSVILLQLLRQKHQVLRNKSQSDELRAELDDLQKYEHKGKSAEDERLFALHKVALRVVGFFDESETVYVVLDRLDQCCDLKERVDHRKLLLKALVRMVEGARCKLRVLVVINGYQWSVEQRRDELEEKVKGRIIVHTAEQENIA